MCESCNVSPEQEGILRRAMQNFIDVNPDRAGEVIYVHRHGAVYVFPKETAPEGFMLYSAVINNGVIGCRGPNNQYPLAGSTRAELEAIDNEQTIQNV